MLPIWRETLHFLPILEGNGQIQRKKSFVCTRVCVAREVGIDDASRPHWISVKTGKRMHSGKPAPEVGDRRRLIDIWKPGLFFEGARLLPEARERSQCFTAVNIRRKDWTSKLGAEKTKLNVRVGKWKLHEWRRWHGRSSWWLLVTFSNCWINAALSTAGDVKV